MEINKEQLESHQSVCDGRYFTWRAFNAVAWAVAILLLGMIGSATSYAIATSTALGKAEQKLETAQQELGAMRATYASIDAKLDRLLEGAK